MDLAVTIFRIGVGLGALLVGIGVVILVLSLRPLTRDTRALANDVRRLARLAEADLPEILTHARELAANAEVLSEDMAVKLDRLGELAGALEEVVAERMEPPPAPRPAIGSVQSADVREDGQIA
jgi:uncharacterized protein YoxC